MVLSMREDQCLPFLFKTGLSPWWDFLHSELTLLMLLEYFIFLHQEECSCPRPIHYSDWQKAEWPQISPRRCDRLFRPCWEHPNLMTSINVFHLNRLQCNTEVVSPCLFEIPQFELEIFNCIVFPAILTRCYGAPLRGRHTKVERFLLQQPYD